MSWTTIIFWSLLGLLVADAQWRKDRCREKALAELRSAKTLLRELRFREMRDGNLPY